MIRGWVDDEHYIELQKDAEGKTVFVAVEVKTGKSKPYTGPVPAEPRQQAVPAIGISDARNITTSPDGKWVAYTRKDNNLYAMDLATKMLPRSPKTAQRPSSMVTPSWVYYGRNTRPRQPLQGILVEPRQQTRFYMRFDDAQVPVFPIYVLDGQNGYLENERYPKAGEKNPEVKKQGSPPLRMAVPYGPTLTPKTISISVLLLDTRRPALGTMDESWSGPPQHLQY